ncbi:RseC/MucC-like positive regulator of sigma(E) [Cricetibacter osteomyelitidis]|uniref:RseC/MucC-like positive regulator of sigma(E) n=1 Tax=Cricetibacter osteomyelitidis TaxID=1521931 RepID=A0A4R2T1K8_9PAST|nr:SoxR reducing system RseC family protein [Cricetibacter osteomyelitidis]TCP88802.1 RseC/MucC-like positive regulator of sigma(E) [Cricetibacter osteomyelitidis]
MLTESAVVIDYNSGVATVQCQAQSACGSCAARKGCGTSILSELAGSKGTHTFTVESLMPLKAGQQVQIGLEEKSLIFTALLMYIVPLTTLLLTTLVCNQFIQNELVTAAIIFLCTALSFIVVKGYAKRLNKKSAYKPILLRVL